MFYAAVFLFSKSMCFKQRHSVSRRQTERDPGGGSVRGGESCDFLCVVISLFQIGFFDLKLELSASTITISCSVILDNRFCFDIVYSNF